MSEDAPTATTVIDLADENLEVLTADFTLLREPEDVLRIARETVRRIPAAVSRIHTFRLEVPREVVAGTEWGKYYATGGSLILSVPVDERLEERAHQYIRSESYQRREEGARALRYFESDENIARVKALLDDPGWAYLRHAEHNSGLEVRIYGVREAAYRTLRDWGVDADKPMIREEICKPESVTTVSLSNTQVTDANLKELGGLKNLRALYLGGTKVTDEGLQHLAGLMSLRYLDLGGTQVANEGLKVLAGFKSLQKVDLGRTQVSDEGIAELRKRRPDLEIEH